MKQRILFTVFIILIIGTSGILAQTFQNPNIIIPDFQVNDNSGPGGAGQAYPAIAANDSGHFVIAWLDGRNEGTAIYAQRFAGDGSVIGPNIEVWELDSPSNDIRFIAVAINDDNNFVITWAGTYDGSNIYAKCFTSDGKARGDVFMVNDEPWWGGPWRGNPSIGMNANGGFVITWERTHIYARQYSSDGIPQGPNFIVNEVRQDVKTNSPSISMTGSGDFVITWCETKFNSNHSGILQSDIYAQRFHSDGSRAGTPYKVNNDEEMDEALSPSVFMTEDGNFVIIWLKLYEESGYDIYAQRFASDGSALGSNFKFNLRLPAAYPGPTIASDDSDTFVVSWAIGNDDLGYEIYAQRFSGDGSPKGGNFKVNGGPKIPWRTNISISANSTGNVFITWIDGCNGHSDIYAQRYGVDGSTLGSNLKVNDDIGSSSQRYAAIATDHSGNFIITWHDYRNFDADIYARRFASDGSPLGDNFRVNDDLGSIVQWNPAISVDDEGNFVIVWQDYRNGINEPLYSPSNADIYAQRYASNGSPLGNNFRINDDTGNTQQWSPSICSDANGDFVITWADKRNDLNSDDGITINDIYAQRFTRDGSAVGNNFKVNDNRGSRNNHSPSVSIDGNGNFTITWNGGSIYAQRFSEDGSLIGNNFRINDNQRYFELLMAPLICSDAEGNFVITWSGYNNGKRDIFAQRFAADGSAAGGNFRVSDARGYLGYGSPSISSEDSGEFIITWAESYNEDWDIYGQRYAMDGSTVGSNFRLTNTSEKQQTSPAVALFNGRIYSAWTDNRAGGSANDIWANVLDWGNPTGVSAKELSQNPSEFALHQNYPNPFNPATTIEYALPKTSHVRIEIYDVLGRHIKTLVNTTQSAGHFQTVWDGTDESNIQVAAGVYFYKMQAGDPSASSGQRFVTPNKLVLIK